MNEPAGPPRHIRGTRDLNPDVVAELLDKVQKPVPCDREAAKKALRLVGVCPEAIEAGTMRSNDSSLAAPNPGQSA